MKYSLSPREIPRAEPKGFPEGSGYISQYIPTRVTIQTFSFSYNRPALAVAYADVTAVSGNVDIAVAVELIASVDTVLASMLTCSQSNIRSHGH